MFDKSFSISIIFPQVQTCQGARILNQKWSRRNTISKTHATLSPKMMKKDKNWKFSKFSKSIESINVSFSLSNNIVFWSPKIHMVGKQCWKVKTEFTKNVIHWGDSESQNDKNKDSENSKKSTIERNSKFKFLGSNEYRSSPHKILISNKYYKTINIYYKNNKVQKMLKKYVKFIIFDLIFSFVEYLYRRKALRVLPAETRLTVYRRSRVWQISNFGWIDRTFIIRVGDSIALRALFIYP